MSALSSVLLYFLMGPFDCSAGLFRGLSPSSFYSRCDFILIAGDGSPPKASSLYSRLITKLNAWYLKVYLQLRTLLLRLS